MKAISKRLCDLENRLGVGPGTEQKLWVVTIVGRQLALDKDACVGILRECGFLPTQRFGVVNLGVIPDGLNAKETERFLREKGAETSA
jgi:hypothetical protein